MKLPPEISVRYLYTEGKFGPRQDGWQVIVDDEYDNDFRSKSEAIVYAEIRAAERKK
jgi:hypothetical protein